MEWKTKQKNHKSHAIRYLMVTEISLKQFLYSIFFISPIILFRSFFFYPMENKKRPLLPLVVVFSNPLQSLLSQPFTLNCHPHLSNCLHIWHYNPSSQRFLLFTAILITYQRKWSSQFITFIDFFLLPLPNLHVHVSSWWINEHLHVSMWHCDNDR